MKGKGDAATCLEHFGFSTRIPIDLVRCVLSPYWPKEANEWVTRKRHHGWPPKDVITKIVNGGIHLVAKPHPKYPDDGEMFRYSFSKAEVVIINTFNRVQKYIFHIIRLAKRNLVNCLNDNGYESPLSSYHFKTLMLWASEEKPLEFWIESEVASSIKELLLQMIEWLCQLKCPHYFMPQCNLFVFPIEHEFDFEKEIQALLNNAMNVDSIVNGIPIFRRDVILPFCFIRSKILTIVEVLLNRAYVYSSPLEKENELPVRTKMFSKIILTELATLYLGIHEQYRAVTRKIKYRQLHRLKALNYLKRAITDNLEHSSAFFLTRDTLGNLIEMSVLGLINCQNSLATSRNEVWKLLSQVIIPSLQSSESQAPNSGDEDLTDKHCCEKFRFESERFMSYFISFTNCFEILMSILDRLPKISYFVSAAYLANFYYVIDKDYDAALRICKDAISKSLSLLDIFMHTQYYGDVCPVILNHKLITIYDSQIQTVFGFVVLFQALQSALMKSQTARKSSGYSCDHSLIFGNDISPSPICQTLTSIELIEYIQYRCESKVSDRMSTTNWSDRKPRHWSKFSQFRRFWLLSAALGINDE